MSLETLELGFLLVSERPALSSVARGLAKTPQDADSAVRRAMRATWLERDAIEDRSELVEKLYGQLRTELRPT